MPHPLVAQEYDAVADGAGLGERQGVDRVGVREEGFAASNEHGMDVDVRPRSPEGAGRGLSREAAGGLGVRVSG
jgi:hypothetical protein